MRWMGKVSAWGAIIFGVLGAIASLLMLRSGLMAAVLYGGSAALLLVSAYRTLNRMPGGLRLLAGAWGLEFGVQAGSLTSMQLVSFASMFLQLVLLALLAITPMLIALAGLALAVLHKEQR